MTRSHAHIPPAAALTVVAAVACFATTDSVMKWLAARHPVPLVMWARWASQVLLMCLFLGPRMGVGLVRTRHLRLQLARGGLLIGSSACMILALKYMPLANATAIAFLTPSLVTLLAVLLLHERLTTARLAFVGVGLAGMLLIVRPGGDIFQGASLFALASAACYSAYQIATRILPSEEDARVSLFYPALFGTVVLTAAWPWLGIGTVPDWLDLLLMLCVGFLGTLGHLMYIRAIQRAPVSALTPFTYVQLVYATVIGWLVFAQLPDFVTFVGMALIAGSGLLMVFHERRRALLAAPPAVD